MEEEGFATKFANSFDVIRLDVDIEIKRSSFSALGRYKQIPIRHLNSSVSCQQEDLLRSTLTN